MALAGTPEQLVERIRDLAAQGLSQLMFLPTVTNQYRLVETFSRQVMARLQTRRGRLQFGCGHFLHRQLWCEGRHRP